jgi:predicted RNase H-like HicB family nuclease
MSRTNKRSPIFVEYHPVNVRVHVQQELDGTWWARIPSLSNRLAHGVTKEEAVLLACEMNAHQEVELPDPNKPSSLSTTV